jgi:uncharacterized protein (TIGR01777 family)
MNILITGATGFVGRRLCEMLHQAGHTVRALSRDSVAAKQGIPLLKEVFPWNPLQELPLLQAFEGCDAVINLAGESIAGRWTAPKKQLIRDSRVLGTKNLVNALAQLSSRPKVLISASAIGYYGDRGEETLTEDAAPGSDFLAQVCRDWENEALKAESLGMRVVRLRIGLVLGRGGGTLQALLPLFRVGLGGPLGSGRQWWSWIHRDDLCRLIVQILANENVSGPINATAPQPVRQKEFAQVLGRVLRRPAFLPTPAFALKIALGEFADGILASQRALPRRAQEMGYRFQFEELEGALREILQT